MAKFMRGTGAPRNDNNHPWANSNNRIKHIQNCNVKIKDSKNPEALVESEYEYFLIVAILIYLYH